MGSRSCVSREYYSRVACNLQASSSCHSRLLHVLLHGTGAPSSTLSLLLQHHLHSIRMLCGCQLAVLQPKKPEFAAARLCSTEGHARAVQGEQLCCIRSHSIALSSSTLPKLRIKLCSSVPFCPAHWYLPAVAQCCQAGAVLPAAAPVACTKQQVCHHGPAQEHYHAVHSFKWLKQHCWAQVYKAKPDGRCCQPALDYTLCSAACLSA